MIEKVISTNEKVILGQWRGGVSREVWLWIPHPTSTFYVEYQAGGVKRLVDLVNQLTFER